MKKSGFIIILLGCAAILVLVGLSNTIAHNRRSTDPDMIIFNKAMRTGMQAFHRQDYKTAKIYIQRAVQVRPESVVAWDTFEKAVRLDQVERIQAMSLPLNQNKEQLKASVTGKLCPCSEAISIRQISPVKPEDFPGNEDDGC